MCNSNYTEQIYSEVWGECYPPRPDEGMPKNIWAQVTHIALQSITFRTCDQAKTWEKLEARSTTLLPEGLYC